MARISRFALIGLALLASPAAGQDMTLAELKDRITEARAEIESLEVEFDFNAVGEAPANSVTREHWTIALEGHSLRLDGARTSTTDGVERTVQERTSWNGQTAWHVREFRANKTAQRSSDPSKVLPDAMQGNPYFEFMRWYPLPRLGAELHSSDLLALVDVPGAMMRPEREAIDGHDCIVIDLSSTNKVQSIWIDPDRGYLPVRHRVTLQGEAVPLVENSITDAIQVTAQAWLPVEARRQVSSKLFNAEELGGNETPRLFITMMKVGRTEDDEPILRVNEEIAPEKFDLEPTLPPGTIVHDMDTDEAP